MANSPKPFEPDAMERLLRALLFATDGPLEAALITDVVNAAFDEEVIGDRPSRHLVVWKAPAQHPLIG